MWPATSVSNDDRADYLRLSHLTALSAGVNNYLRCIHKGLTAFSRVTPPILMHDQTIFNKIFWSDDASGSWLPVVLNRWYDNTKKSLELIICNWRATAYTSLETNRFSVRFGTIPDWYLRLCHELDNSYLIHYFWTVVLVARKGSLF